MAKSFIPSQELDFQNYKDHLKNYLKSQDRFKDYDFEGSNLSVLLDILAYNTFNHAHYLNMVGSEMFLDTSLLRESIVSHAKELNYVPRSRVSARTSITVEIAPSDSPAYIIIPKYYQFKTTSSLSSLKFITDQQIVISRDNNGRYISAPFYIYEGELVIERFTVQPTTTTTNGVVQYNQRFILQSENIDVSSIEVYVYNNSTTDASIEYTKAESLYGLVGTSNVFFVQGYKKNQYEIAFGDSHLGAALQQGNIVEVRYRDTSGEEGNGSYIFSKTVSISNYSDITVDTLERCDGGAERESNDSIKYNAVRHFQVQDRAVTEYDFQSLVTENFPEIQKVAVFGGEKVSQYGKVFIALKPFSISGAVSTNLKTRIIEFLKTKTLVPEPVIIDPEYYYIGLTANVYYDSNVTSDKEDEIRAAIYSSILALNNTVLGDFNVSLYQSVVDKTIQDSHVSITGCSVEMRLINRWAPVVNTSFTYQFSAGNELITSTSVEPAFYSSAFTALVAGVQTTVFLKDDTNGSIKLYTKLGTSDLDLNITAGTIDYSTGKVTLTQSVVGYNPYIQLIMKLAGNDVNISLNKFALFDAPDISINLIGR